MAAMKPTKPCPGGYDLDIHTLSALLGGDFKLERLLGRRSCWQCNSKHVALDWWVSDKPTPPGGTAEQTAQVLRLKPPRLRPAQERFRAIEGGKRVYADFSFIACVILSDMERSRTALTELSTCRKFMRNINAIGPSAT